jgi:rubredoxin
MALAKAFDEAKGNQRLRSGDVKNGVEGTTLGTEFFDGSQGVPHAALLEFSPGRSSQPHFHPVDQFQVLIKGKGKMGRHDMGTHCIHFSRAYTPYGPFVSDKEVGLVCFNLHGLIDQNYRALHLPQEAERLKQVPNRQPWQITTHATFPDNSMQDAVLDGIPGLRDENGLAGYTLSMKPNAKRHGPGSSDGEGQYLVLVEGSILHEGKELKAPALVFIFPQETYEVRSGASGAKVLVLNFPTTKNKAMKPAPSDKQEAGGMKLMGCDLCSFVYEEELGLANEGVAAGTRWKDLPEDWTCPDCGASKREFHALEI